jgi:VCBS repeat-containing protein
MDGRGGSDTVDAGVGADSLIYRLGENAGARDLYKGGSGIDTLALHLTQNEWGDAGVRAELERYVSFLDTVTRSSKGEVALRGNDFVFNFPNAASLTVQTIEKLAVYVQDSSGQYVLVNHLASVVGGDASGTVTEAGSGSLGVPTATGDLSADDLNGPDDAFRPEGSAAAYGSYSVSSTGVWTYALNNANSDVQALNAGGTLTDTFTVYTQDGTGQDITVTINGMTDNHTPTAVALTPANPGAGLPQAGVFGTLSTTDADAGDTHTYSLANDHNGLFAIDGNTVVLTAALEMSQTYELEIQSTDQIGATLASPTIYRVFTGTNGNDGIDAPWLTGTGNYIAFGLDGIDLLEGGAGDDWLFGGMGSNELFGGTGNDMFVLDVGESWQPIHGFGAGDKIALQDTNLSIGPLESLRYGDGYTSGVSYLGAYGFVVYSTDGSNPMIIGALVPDAGLPFPSLVNSDFIVI